MNQKKKKLTDAMLFLTWCPQLSDKSWPVTCECIWWADDSSTFCFRAICFSVRPHQCVGPPVLCWRGQSAQWAGLISATIKYVWSEWQNKVIIFFFGVWQNSILYIFISYWDFFTLIAISKRVMVFSSSNSVF